MAMTPIADVETERAVLGAALWRPEEAACWGLQAEDFSTSEHREIFEAWARVLESGTAMDVEAVADDLRRRGAFERVGGWRGLTDLPQEADQLNAEQLRDIARRRTIRDQVLDVAVATERASLAEVTAKVNALATRAGDLAAPVETLTSTDLVRRALAKLAHRSSPDAMIHPGLEGVRRYVGDIPVGSLIVLGGHTNAGKSSVALCMLRAAARRNVKCGYVSFEDGPELVGSRLLAYESGVSSFRLMTGMLNREDMEALGTGANRASELETHLLSEHPIGGTENDAISAMTRLARRGCKLIAVDYIQAINAVGPQQDRRNEIRVVCSRLKAAAVRLGVVLVLVSQLARPRKGEEFNEPTKHDLKEAGDLENAAEVVLLAYKRCEGPDLFLRVAKLKWGSVGSEWQMTRDQSGALVEMARQWS